MLIFNDWSTLVVIILLLIKQLILWTFLWQKREYRLDRMLDYLALPESRRLLLDKWFWLKSSLAILTISFFWIQDLNLINFWWFFNLSIWILEIAEFLIKTVIRKTILKPVLTTKMKLIWILNWIFISFLSLSVLTITQPTIKVFISNVVLLWYPFLVFLSIFLLKPVEKIFILRLFTSAKNYRSKLKKLQVIAISGAFGKSTTKELLTQILATKMKVESTKGFENVSVSTAKRVLKIDQKTEFFISEIGSYKLGEGKMVCQFLHPDLAIITGLNLQHYSLFKSRKNIIYGESEALDFLPDGATAYINYSSPMCREIVIPNRLKLVRYGVLSSNQKPSEYDIYADNLETSLNGTKFNLHFQDQSLSLKTNLTTTGNIQNLVGVLALSLDQGLKIQALTKVLQNLNLPEKTLNIKTIGKNTVIDDSHNSNVDGVLNSLELVKNYQQKNFQPIIFLDEIVELGKLTQEEHQKIAKELVKIPESKIVLLGRNYSVLLSSELINLGFNSKQIYDLNLLGATKIKEKLKTWQNSGAKKVFLFQGFQAQKWIKS